MSLGERIKEAYRWYKEALNRFFGARKNLRAVRDDINKATKELRDIQDRIPHAQGGVLDDLRAKEARLKEKIKEYQRVQKDLAEQVKRRKIIAERLKQKWKALKEKEEQQEPSGAGAVGFSAPDKPWNPYRKNIPNWMIPWLDKSRSAGWSGVVVSGVRTPAYSQQLCYNMCGAPTCPGRCAGIYSNHNMESHEKYPEGALDVSDYYTFARVQVSIGSPLKNSLGAQDPVHFSVSGN